ncbi:slipin family protein, partial [Streptomyces sp. NPDC050659]
LLQTVVAVAAEKNSTLVLPFPVELLRFLERAQQAQEQPRQRPEERPQALPESGAQDSEAGDQVARGESKTGQD